LKENGTIHFYSVGDEKDLFSNGLKEIEVVARKLNKKIKNLNMKKILPYSPRRWKVCIEFVVS
jgi:tRNA G37 N-methylase Trm5